MSASIKNRVGAFGRAFALFGAAVSASAAVENNRRPHARDLEILGIDPQAFRKVR
ncbi:MULTISPECIES: hypothetical protein [Rhizobium/Agrobacterium group]|jgi:hypothetical protein|uniref:Uncharacterized protein n=1 Tax=Rhizobium soli TaxID=424798 RepID=A0A7X0JI32_9HYPH|nr:MULTISPECIES: hypothetical protein [Rhizobium/Agrobacterium group]MBB6508004.1 hypothetical protein [Rhizobium soli]MBD8652410.1 hypothetical protein [Rhizobium sp. CFBP 13726]MBD8665012.1 hypothetical protein [Rhizobium sp. CFBP 8752]MBP2463164.1 hypothetical protein [Rhizobium sp. PvP014]MBP2530559.1 hypothetical protein [Rhizobium sp. PvP099]